MNSRILSFLNTLKIISSSPDSQIRYLEKNNFFNYNSISYSIDNFNIDEIGLIFDDDYYVIYDMFENDIIQQYTFDLVIKLADQLESISGGTFPEKWTVSALKNDDFWVEIRKTARAAHEAISNDIK